MSKSTEYSIVNANNQMKSYDVTSNYITHLYSILYNVILNHM